ncbi:MAG: ABC transporter ATP-binding protein [Oscillochloris sp.]|nr:ABC transporter ATP-binding protein [Oscillochloris sp.]
MPLKRYWQLLSTYLHSHRRRAVLLAVLVLAGIGLQLLGPQLIAGFLDIAASGAAGAALLLLAAAYIAAGLAQRAAALGAIYVGENLGWLATNALRADLSRHVVGLDMGFHKVHTPGELLERLDGDVTTLANFFSQFVIRVLGNGLLVLGILALIWREDWRAGLALTIYAGLAVFMLGAVQQYGAGRWSSAQAAAAAVFGFLEERLAGGEDIRAAGAEAHTLRRFDGLMHAQMRTYRSARMAGNLAFAATTFLTTAGYAAGLAAAALLYLNGAVSIGGAFLIVAYVAMLAGPLERLREQAQDLQQAGGAIERIAELFSARPLVVEQANPQLLPAGPLGLAFAEVHFSYNDSSPENGATPEAAPVLRNISLNLRPGETLGLLGRTGSGKSTLSRLIFRLYDPQQGAISLADRDLRTLELADLRRRVGMVTQDVQIFHASVRDNLTLFDRSISDQRIMNALRELELEEWLASLPAGLDTLIGGAQGLSAGEAQLLAFARVLLKDPGLMILDEASSRLDPATERRLERAIDRLLHGRTAIVIAHRLSTVERVDRIAILEQGALIETGPRVDLAADPDSRFSRLLRAGIEEVLA